MFRPEVVETGSHIITVFPNPDAEKRGVLEFLKHGLLRNESVMLVTDLLTKEEALDRMSSEWMVNARELERGGDIIIKSTKEWYFPDGVLDLTRIGEKWNAVVSMCLMRGKRGLRVSGGATGFFKAGFIREAVKYESGLTPRFDIPLTALCAYTVDEISLLSTEEIDRLEEHHDHFWVCSL